MSRGLEPTTRARGSTGLRRQGDRGFHRAPAAGSSRLFRFAWNGTALRARLTERRRSESNRRIEVLQTSALPLGYGAGGLKMARTLTVLNPLPRPTAGAGSPP